MSKIIIVETRRQHVGVGVIQSLDACITTIGVEMVLVPNMGVVKRGILIRSITKLSSGSSGILVGRILS
jgi:hypothetical protein